MLYPDLPMFYRALADVVVLVHAAFIVFVTLGALLALRWPRIVWLHIPCLGWGILLEVTRWVCPLTPLEVRLREAAGGAGYSGGFIDHYLLPVIYPAGLTQRAQWLLALLLFAVNLGLYGLVLWRHRRTADQRDRQPTPS